MKVKFEKVGKKEGGFGQKNSFSPQKEIFPNVVRRKRGTNCHISFS